jgi:hypothetical protein
MPNFEPALNRRDNPTLNTNPNLQNMSENPENNADRRASLDGEDCSAESHDASSVKEGVAPSDDEEEGQNRFVFPPSRLAEDSSNTHIPEVRRMT